MASERPQIKFRLSGDEHKEVEGAAGTLSVPEFCKRLVLECVRGRRPLKPDVHVPAASAELATRGKLSAEARAAVQPIPKGGKSRG